MQPSTSGLTVWATEVIWTLDSGERKFSWISPPHWSQCYLFRNWFHDQYRKAANDREKTWNMLGAMVPVLVGNVSFAKSKWKTCSLGVYMNQIDSTVNTNKNLMKINEVKKTHARMWMRNTCQAHHLQRIYICKNPFRWGSKKSSAGWIMTGCYWNCVPRRINSPMVNLHPGANNVPCPPLVMAWCTMHV